MLLIIIFFGGGGCTVKKSFNDPSNDLKDKERAVQSSKDEVCFDNLLLQLLSWF